MHIAKIQGHPQGDALVTTFEFAMVLKGSYNAKT